MVALAMLILFRMVTEEMMAEEEEEEEEEAMAHPNTRMHGKRILPSRFL